MTLPTFATVNLPSGRDDEFAENNILFYNPNGGNDPCNDPGGGGLNLSATIDDLPASVVQKLDNEKWVEKANKNKERYQYAEQQTGVPWLVLAAIHYREGGMNPNTTILNGEPLTDHTNVDGQHVSSDAKEDAKNAANHLIGNGKTFYKVDVSTDHSLESLAWAALAYNRGGMYKNNTNPSTPYTDSPYVVNFFDADHMNMIFPNSADEPASTRGKHDSNVGFLTMLVYLNGRIGGSSSGGNSGGSQSSNKDGSDITLIGDSITERTKSEFLKKYPKADVYSKTSKQFYTGTSDNPSGYTILKGLVDEGKLRSTLIFALGTNNTGLTAKQAQEVVDLAGKKTTVIFLTNYVNGAEATNNNNVFKKIKDDNKNVIVVGWAEAVKDDPSTYLSDGTHPTDKGVELWIKLISEALGSNSANPNCPDRTTVGGVTTYTYEGRTYAFPIAGATKANVLNGKNGYATALSPLPCTSYTGCHHDSPAVDTGIKLEPSKAAEYGGSESDMMYYSTGAQTVAIVDGQITSYSSGYNGDSKCASISYKGDDGRNYWIGHTFYDSSIKSGDRFKAGQAMTLIGNPHCALGTQAHIHVNTTEGTCTRSNRSGCTKDAIDIINAGYNALPEK